MATNVEPTPAIDRSPSEPCEEQLRRSAVSPPYAYGHPNASGLIRCTTDDFQVDEYIGIEPRGEGEHCWLQVRKRGQNTEWLGRQLARFAGVPAARVSYAGLKDRHAVTTQWFSVHLAGCKEPDWSRFDTQGCEILAVQRHTRKLRRGALRGNHFVINVRGLHGARDALEGRLRQIAEHGVPNYFGPQRFGRDTDNLRGAAGLFSTPGRRLPRHRRSLYLSAARSALFNHVLGARVASGEWDQALAGDVMVLDSKRGFFTVEEPDAELVRRCTLGEIHPSAPLWGRGDPLSRGAVQRREVELLDGCASWCAGLEAAGLRQERRATRVKPRNLSWRLLADGIQLRFSLPAGSFATAVLREAVIARDAMTGDGSDAL